MLTFPLCAVEAAAGERGVAMEGQRGASASEHVVGDVDGDEGPHTANGDRANGGNESHHVHHRFPLLRDAIVHEQTFPFDQKIPLVCLPGLLPLLLRVQRPWNDHLNSGESSDDE